MSQLENCIRGLHRRSVALNLTNRRKEKINGKDHSYNKNYYYNKNNRNDPIIHTAHSIYTQIIN